MDSAEENEMKAFKLLKKYTDEKVLKLLTLSVSLIGLVTTQAYASTSSEVGSSLDVAHFNSCQANESEITRIQRELNNACREAGLGSRAACIQTLHDCEGEDAEENDQCLPHMTTEADVKKDRERLEELRDRQNALNEQIEEQQQAVVGFEQEAVEINRLKGEAQAKLQQALADVGTQRAEAQAKLNMELEQLEIAVDQAKDQLATLTLGFREFTLSKIDECHEKAEQHNTQVYSNYVQAARGGRARYSQASLFRATGMSVREIARNQANREMKRCMALRVRTQGGGTEYTPYGRRYALERDKIKQQQSVIDREIDRMMHKRRDVQTANRATLANIARAEGAVISAHQAEVVSLNQQGAVLVRQEQQALRRIDQLNMQSMGLMLDITNMENELQRSHGEGIKVASDDEMEAYREAQQAADSLLDAAQNASHSVDRCNNQNFISGILDMFENDDVRAVASSGDGEATILATPEDGGGSVGSDGVPTSTAPRAGSADDVVVTPGSQTI